MKLTPELDDYSKMVLHQGERLTIQINGDPQTHRITGVRAEDVLLEYDDFIQKCATTAPLTERRFELYSHFRGKEELVYQLPAYKPLRFNPALDDDEAFTFAVAIASLIYGDRSNRSIRENARRKKGFIADSLQLITVTGDRVSSLGAEEFVRIAGYARVMELDGSFRVFSPQGIHTDTSIRLAANHWHINRLHQGDKEAKVQVSQYAFPSEAEHYWSDLHLSIDWEVYANSLRYIRANWHKFCAK